MLGLRIFSPSIPAQYEDAEDNEKEDDPETFICTIENVSNEGDTPVQSSVTQLTNKPPSNLNPSRGKSSVTPVTNAPPSDLDPSLSKEIYLGLMISSAYAAKTSTIKSLSAHIRLSLLFHTRLGGAPHFVEGHQTLRSWYQNRWNKSK